MKVKKLIALGLCAAMVSGMTVSPVLAAEDTAEEADATEETAEDTTEEADAEDAEATEEDAEATDDAAAEEETTEDADAAEEDAEATDDAAASDDPTAQFDGLKANEAYEFPMMVKSFQATYWDAAQEGMKKAAEELGVTYTAQGPNSESDIADQVNMINTAISSNPVGLGLAACDTSSVLDALQECADKGIPVVTFDTGVDNAPEGSVVCNVATDNAQAGAVAAENMYNAIKDVIANADGQVIIGEVNQDATAQNIQQRGGGFINKMIELLQADGKTVAVTGNEFYVNAAEGADATESDADVIIQVAVPAQTTVEPLLHRGTGNPFSGKLHRNLRFQPGCSRRCYRSKLQPERTWF